MNARPNLATWTVDGPFERVVASYSGGAGIWSVIRRLDALDRVQFGMHDPSGRQAILTVVDQNPVRVEFVLVGSSATTNPSSIAPASTLAAGTPPPAALMPTELVPPDASALDGAADEHHSYAIWRSTAPLDTLRTHYATALSGLGFTTLPVEDPSAIVFNGRADGRTVLVVLEPTADGVKVSVGWLH